MQVKTDKVYQYTDKLDKWANKPALKRDLVPLQKIPGNNGGGSEEV